MAFDPYSNFPEAYEIVKTAIIVHEGRTFKVEVLQDMQKNDFCTRVYVKANLKSTPVYPDVLYDRDVTIWSKIIEFPWTNRDTPEGAMGQALGFLKERYKKD